ncbi:MAG: heterodisulfide reductase subunit A, partial [Pseudomonadota bacterium]
DPKIALSRGKVGKITEVPGTGNLIVEAENTLTGELMRVETELVVLATGMAPAAAKLAGAVVRDQAGFAVTDAKATGLIAAGCVRKPGDVACSAQDATRAAIHAIQASVRRSIHG